MGNSPVVRVDYLGLLICNWIPEGPRTTGGAPGWVIGYYVPPKSWIGTMLPRAPSGAAGIAGLGIAKRATGAAVATIWVVHPHVATALF